MKETRHKYYILCDEFLSNLCKTSVGAGGYGGSNYSPANVHKVTFLGDGHVLELDGAGGCIAV